MPSRPKLVEEVADLAPGESGRTDAVRSKPNLDDRLFLEVYEELRRLARGYMRKERVGHTLQPTALVHQAYMRLFSAQPARYRDRTHLLALAAGAMRHVLIDHAVARNAGKRGRRLQLSFQDALATTEDRPLDGLLISQLLDQLATLDERQARIVELKIFSGMSFDEIGAVLSISSRTAKRDWSMARAWLKQQLSRVA